MKCLWIFLFSFKAWSATIDFEHSLAFGEGSMWETEGSMWETEDSLSGELQIPDSDLPTIFKIDAPDRRVKIGETDLGHRPERFFAEGQPRLFRQLRICYDSRAQLRSPELTEALNQFRSRLSGPRADDELFRIIETDVVQPLASECDVYFQRGSWSEFPYSRLQKLKGKSVAWQNQVYAIFFQRTHQSLPIVTLHPDIVVAYHGSGQYLESDGLGISIDGRGLILHEIGHVLGWIHLPSNADRFGVLSMMSVMNKDPLYNDLQTRFVKSYKIWDSWNYIQISTYRRLLWGQDLQKAPAERRRICLQVGETFSLRGALQPRNFESVPPWSEWEAVSNLDFLLRDLQSRLLMKNSFFSIKRKIFYSLSSSDSIVALQGVDNQHLVDLYSPVFSFKIERPATDFKIQVGALNPAYSGTDLHSFEMGVMGYAFNFSEDPRRCP